MKIQNIFFSILTAAIFVTNPSVSLAAVSFTSATNAATLAQTIEEDGARVFVFSGIADGESTTLTFSNDSTCPGVAMTGGAEFVTKWSCADGVISATVTHRGGMSFGPNGTASTFYVTFNNPPAPPGSDTAPAALSGIQISVFGDVTSWNLTGEMTSSGTQFGIELSGSQGGDAHFRMDLPQAAADYLGGILGVFVGGKPDPFSTVTTDEDGSVSIVVDIASLTGSSTSAANIGSKAGSVTKKITAGVRSLNVAFKSTKLKAGKSTSLAMCAGTTFAAGDKVIASFTLDNKAISLKKSFVLGSNGCAKTSVKPTATGKLGAKISYQGSKAKASATVSK